MSWDPGGKSRKRNYHHGNLREALIDAALRLINEKGPGGFSFAEAARAAGVSAAAPYRHFRDRDALMADVALRGFKQFGQELTATWNDGKPAPLQALNRVGRAYLDFARREPALYASMFESGIAICDYPELDAASQAAFGVLRQACEALAATLPQADRPPALMMALHIWALSHGIASLFARGDGARRPIPMPPEDLLEAAVLVYLEGLGLSSRPPR